jgi:hypothetical protein
MAARRSSPCAGSFIQNILSLTCCGGFISQVTNFFDPEVFPAEPDGRGEIVQGKNLVDAAKEVGVGFFIWRYPIVLDYIRSID